jgi:NADPH2:quinone reductase
MKTQAMLVRAFGGPEVLEAAEVDVAAPSGGEVLLRHLAIGVNFVDVYYRTGQFGGHDAPPLPAIVGVQGAGVVEALGPEAGRLHPGLAVGDLVAYAGQPGAYVEHRLLPADRVLRLPVDIPAELAGACLVRGLTAEYLLRRLYRVQPGDTVLIHAAAGGVGRIACQWAKALGATVIGTVGSDEKARIAAAHGCDHPIVYTREDFVERVKAITGGRGVPVVYDSVGRDTFMRSLDCLRPMGMAINFGTASGQVEPFPLQRLLSKSLIVTRPTLVTYIADRDDYVTAAAAFFDVVRSGAVRVEIGTRYALRDASRAHAELESRRAIGLPVLVP